jgi:hypothetical protein
VNESLDEEAVGDPDQFILIQRQVVAAVQEGIALGFKFIATNVAFIEDSVVHLALAQKIASRQIGVAEMEMNRMVRGHCINCVEFKELGQWDATSQEWPRIKIEPSEIYVQSPDDAFKQVFKLLHEIVSCMGCRESNKPTFGLLANTYPSMRRL